MKGLSFEDFVATMRDAADVEGPGTMAHLLNEAADRLTAMSYDAGIVARVRSGEILKYCGRDVIIINYDWWKTMIDKTGFRPVPSAEDLGVELMQGGEEDGQENDR